MAVLPKTPSTGGDPAPHSHIKRALSTGSKSGIAVRVSVWAILLLSFILLVRRTRGKNEEEARGKQTTPEQERPDRVSIGEPYPGEALQPYLWYPKEALRLSRLEFYSSDLFASRRLTVDPWDVEYLPNPVIFTPLADSFNLPLARRSESHGDGSPGIATANTELNSHSNPSQNAPEENRSSSGSPENEGAGGLLNSNPGLTLISVSTQPPFPSPASGPSVDDSSPMVDANLPYVCPDCNCEFRTAGQMRSHHKRKHKRRYPRSLLHCSSRFCTTG